MKLNKTFKITIKTKFAFRGILTKKKSLTEEEEKQFNQFLEIDGFAEALAIAWRFGLKRKDSFTIRNKQQWISERFHQLIIRSNTVRYNERLPEEKSGFWEVDININHPFLQTIKEMGWTSISKGNYYHV
ncbi:TPA: hypothetical protein ROX84_005225 [Bacillus thuringiensis]|nr:hypothetical protein [Bacillus thuringiensis]